MVHDQGEIIGKHYSMSLVYTSTILFLNWWFFNQDKLFQRPIDPWESLFLDNGMDVPIIIRVITGCLSRDLEILIIPNWTNYLDSIETNIENAVVDIQQGNTQLRQARDHQVKNLHKSWAREGLPIKDPIAWPSRSDIRKNNILISEICA